MNPKLISGISTAAIVALAILLMSLNIFAYEPPDPPTPEEGVEVNLGDSDFGLGDSPEPASQATSYAPPASQEQVITQRSETTTPIPNSPKPGNVTNPAAETKSQPENKEPAINKNALFPGKRNQNSGGGSEGVTQGNGNQGKSDGNTNSNNYTGNGGNGKWTLDGRTAVSLPSPKYESNKQGTVVIAIWVDQQGRVTRAEYQPKGSNTQDGYLVNQAKTAALKARFNADTKAVELQKGTITYIFTNAVR
ncbi:MAG: TonB family protein [Bacteroidales bacterium]|nr:TonB family protein [Bacteroidales bacterium]